MRSAQNTLRRLPSLQRVPLGGGSCFAEPDIHLLSQVFARPSQKIDFVLSASPETIRRKPREIPLRRPVGNKQDLAACAPCNLSFLPQAAVKPPGGCGLLNERNPVVRDRLRAARQPSSGPQRSWLG